MEADRFKLNQKYYIVGILCLVISLALFAFSFYILPFLAFGWHYGVPDFILIWNIDMQESYKLSQTAASWLIFLGLFFPAVILAIIADILSNRIDSQIHGISNKNEVKKPERMKVGAKESNGLVFKIIVIMILVFIAAQFFQWALSSSPI